MFVPADPMINDAHCHFFSRRFFELLAAPRPDRGGTDPAGRLTRELGWETPGTAAELADRWALELDRHGVSRAALIASIPGDEDSVAEAVARHPSRFVGFFMLDPTAPDPARRAARALGPRGLRCVCLYPAMHHYPLDDERVEAVFEAAEARRGAAVFVHCGLLSVGVRKKLGLPSPFATRFGNPLDLQKTAARHGSVPIVIPHFGAGLFREALMLGEACANVHLDTSSSNSWIRFHPGLTLSTVFRTALEVMGPERLLFGTDSSYFPRGWQRAIYEAQRSALDEAGVDQDAQRGIVAGNFDRLFTM